MCVERAHTLGLTKSIQPVVDLEHHFGREYPKIVILLRKTRVKFYPPNNPLLKNFKVFSIDIRISWELENCATS